MIRGVLLLASIGLASCAPLAEPVAERRQPLQELELPSMRTFAAQRAPDTTRSNASIARDFMDLSFRLESGRRLDVFTRFEEPITVRLRGDASRILRKDLAELLERLRREAGIDISQVPPDRPASVTVEVVDQARMRRAVPKAACFVIPRLTSWREFRARRRGEELDWTTLRKRERVAIFVPSGIAPQEGRDCLHEELAQALGPLNDLFRLTDSVFNDDNFHTVLTRFDMLVLRATYAPELASGMSPRDVAARLPAILARIHPEGRAGEAPPPAATPRAWISSIEDALTPGASRRKRLSAAQRAVKIASDRGWSDNRRAFALYVLGRLSVADDPETALSAFLDAARFYHSQPETRLHAAHVAMQMAAWSLSAGDAEATLLIVDRHLGAVREGRNAALLATLLMVKAEALELQGRQQEAEVVRLESLGWARYGLGSNGEIERRAAEIRALSPRDETRS